MDSKLQEAIEENGDADAEDMLSDELLEAIKKAVFEALT
jgi:hypothetical protein